MLKLSYLCRRFFEMIEDLKKNVKLKKKETMEKFTIRYIADAPCAVAATIYLPSVSAANLTVDVKKLRPSQYFVSATIEVKEPFDYLDYLYDLRNNECITFKSLITYEKNEN